MNTYNQLIKKKKNAPVAIRKATSQRPNMLNCSRFSFLGDLLYELWDGFLLRSWKVWFFSGHLCGVIGEDRGSRCTIYCDLEICAYTGGFHGWKRKVENYEGEEEAERRLLRYTFASVFLMVKFLIVGKGMVQDTKLKDIFGGVQWLQEILERFNRIRSVRSLFGKYKEFLETLWLVLN